MASAPSFIASSSVRLAGEELKFASYTSNSITAHKSWRRSMVKTLAVMAPAQKERAPATTGSVKHALTMTEKILARASERSQLDPGENVWVNVDVLMTHDICGPGTFGIFKQEFGEDAKVWDREKIVIIPDHYIFTSDVRANRNVDILRDFCREQNIKYFYDIKDLGNFRANPDYKGVCHVALAQEGHCRPGEVLLGTDSHTCTAGAFGQFATGIGNTDAGFVLGTGKLLLKVPPTLRFVLNGEMPKHLLAKDLILQIIGEITVAGATYKSMEFVGSAIEGLNMEERMTLCNMVIEAGGKNGVIPADETTFKYLEGKTSMNYEPVYSDQNARFMHEYRIDVSKLEPLVAKPHSPDNRALARECKDVKVDRVYIGSCTGGKTEDFMAAAKIFLASGKKVKVPTFLVPATQKVWMDVYSLPVPGTGGKTCSQIFEEAGCDTPASPSCGACLGGPQDTHGRMNEPQTFTSKPTDVPTKEGDDEFFDTEVLDIPSNLMKEVMKKKKDNLDHPPHILDADQCLNLVFLMKPNTDEEVNMTLANSGEENLEIGETSLVYMVLTIANMTTNNLANIGDNKAESTSLAKKGESSREQNVSGCRTDNCGRTPTLKSFP